MSRRHKPHWHLWSTRQGTLGNPEPISKTQWYELTRNREQHHSGDGHWLELHDPDGSTAAVLVDYQGALSDLTRRTRA